MRFIDSSTGRHRFTVQIPARQDFDFWVPEGAYQIYFADTDISDRMDQLVRGDVNRHVQDKRLDKGWIYQLGMEMRPADKSNGDIAAEKWGREGPTTRQ
jgi:hypothetical protein